MRAIEISTSQETTKFSIPSRTQLCRQPLMTERLVIEPFRANISERFYKSVEESRSSLAPWLPWVPFNNSPAASQRYALASEEDWDRGVALRFFLRPRNRPDFIGAVTLESLIRLHRNCDLGYWLHPAWTKKGLMQEAAARLIDFAYDTIGVHRIRAAAAVENAASRRLIERLGFVEEGLSRQAERVAGRWITHVVYSQLAHERPQQRLNEVL